MSSVTLLTVPPGLLPDMGRNLLRGWIEGGAGIPRVVVTASAAVGRNLLQRVAEGSPGAVGLHMVTLPDLARQMASPRLDAWIMPPHADRVIAADLLAEDAGPYGDLALKLPVAVAMARAIRDLRESGLEDLPAKEILGELRGEERFRFEHLARIFRRYDAHLTRHGLADDATLYRAAQGAPLPGGAKEVLVYGIYDLTGLQRELLAEIGRHNEVTWLCPAAPPDSPSCELLEELLVWAESRGFSLRETELTGGRDAVGAAYGLPAGDIRILGCPGDRAEAREIARDLLGAARQGGQFGRMAVLMSRAARQESLLREEFERAGIPVCGRSPRRLLERPYGRALRAVIALAAGEGGRGEVSAVLRARLEAEDDPALSPSAVDRILRLAGCGGVDPTVWEALLRRLRKGLAREEAWEAKQGEGRPAPSSRSVRSVEVGRVAEMAAALFDALGAFRRALEHKGKRKGAWSEISHDLIGMTCQLGLEHAAGGALFEAARDAARLLSGWDKLGIAPRSDLALELWLERLLEVQSRVGEGDEGRGLEGRRGGEGVLLLDWNHARGLRLDAVWLTGLSHDNFAPPGHPDPILGDIARERLVKRYGCLLKRAGDRFRERDLLFSLGLAAGQSSVVLSWPRLDDVKGQTRQPVDPLARLIEERSGEVLDPENPAASPAVERISSAPPGLSETDAGRALLRVEEYDIAAVREDDAELSAHLASYTDLARSRRADRLRLREREYNEYCGLVGRGLAASDAFSVTGLEELARCPFRFFLRHLLGLRVWEDAAAITPPQPRDVGAVAHRVLEDLFRTFEDGLPPAAEKDSELLERIPRWVALRIREVIAQGALGSRALWNAESMRIRSCLERYVLVEVQRMRTEGLRVAQMEVPLDGELTISGSSLQVRGRPDRVDRDAAGGHRVVDYKWSKNEKYPRPEKGELYQGGRSLQVPLYARLLEERLPAAERDAQGVEQFRVVSLKASPRKGEFVVDRPYLLSRREELGELVSGLRDFAVRGEFLPLPNGGAECSSCDYRVVCGPHQAWIEERKSEDPRYRRHTALVEQHP